MWIFTILRRIALFFNPPIDAPKRVRSAKSLKAMMLEYLTAEELTAKEITKRIMADTGREDENAVSNNVRGLCSLLSRNGIITKRHVEKRGMVYTKAHVVALPQEERVSA
jgi:hypothetical protein